MAHQLGEPLPGAPPPFHPQQYSSSGVHHEAQHHGHESSMDDLEGSTRVPRNCPRTHPWCSVPGCTERPLRQCQAASGNQIAFMCKTHFNSVPASTREGWKQYRGTRTFPETRIAAPCRPGPNRGHGPAVMAAAAAAAASELDPGYTNHPDDEKASRGPPKSALWPGKVYNVLYQVWNAHAEQKKISTGDGYMTSFNRAALVPEAANALRDQGHPEMASILDNTTEGARKVIHSRVLAKYLKNREAFLSKIRTIGLEPTEVSEWEAALDAAQHHADLAPSRERDPAAAAAAYPQQPGVPSSPGQRDASSEAVAVAAAGGGSAVAAAAAAAGAGAGAAAGATAGGEAGGGAGVEEPGRPLYNPNGAAAALAMLPRKKPGRKPGKMGKGALLSPEAKRARALDSMASAAERSNRLQEGAAAAGAEHMRRLELADAERLAMEKEEHALRMAIGKSALALLNKMAGEPPLQLSPPVAPVAPPPQPQPQDEPAAGPSMG